MPYLVKKHALLKDIIPISDMKHDTFTTLINNFTGAVLVQMNPLEFWRTHRNISDFQQLHCQWIHYYYHSL